MGLLPTISAPTLIIHGSDDVLNPTGNAYLLRECIPGAEVYIVAGGRHGSFHEFREEAREIGALPSEFLQASSDRCSFLIGIKRSPLSKASVPWVAEVAHVAEATRDGEAESGGDYTPE